ncbi:hypothetical protein HZU40_22465 [Mycolicibacterium fluoranthenivorans]|uniref:Uncharacterized protein n=2 Tax=Mycolicibacterium fluoranthenivorans TaxID=258505 RepID=A0A7G8P9G3_9MYCO|nr:hypothetical protein HZU40_22465 [Mycolicibacterium fluoranthenivorans]
MIVIALGRPAELVMASPATLAKTDPNEANKAVNTVIAASGRKLGLTTDACVLIMLQDRSKITISVYVANKMKQIHITGGIHAGEE